jgi:hypothetical protein
MAQTLNVFLINKAGDLSGRFDATARTAAAGILKGFFDDVINGSAKYNATSVTWGGSASQPVLGDFVCYLLTTGSDSIVAQHATGPTVTLGPSGTTMADPVSKAVISEIYLRSVVQGGDPRGNATANKENAVAAIIFHELGHNLLDATTPIVQTVHNMSNADGLLRNTDTSPLQPNETPNATDNAAFRTGFLRRGAGVKQWTGDM